MYLVLKNIIERYIIREIEKCTFSRVKIKYVNNVPHIDSPNISSIDAFSHKFIYKLFTKILDFYGVHKYWDANSTKFNPSSFEDTKYGLNMIYAVKNFRSDSTTSWSVWQLNDIMLYEISDFKVNKLLLLLFIDPLAFISKMRDKINDSTEEVKTFFGDIEISISCTMNKYLAKYLLINLLECCGIVNDVILLVMNKWIYLEILALEI